MNQIIKDARSLAMAILCFFSTTAIAQNISSEPAEGGGAYPYGRNDAGNPCISPAQYKAIERRVADNIQLLKLNPHNEQRTTTTLFSWPLREAAGFTDCSYYFITNYVDQDATTGIKDYNCGTVTYDGHRGTDIATGPYPFYKMDNNQVEVIAAAPGTIIDKSDGYFDRNCVMNTDTANYIIIQHADGSLALYWHMKKFSLTSKIIGQTVAVGEFLGVVGSSGDATGPHLHFEVWASTLSSSLNDPYAGTCNLLNSTTWWTTQKPYTEPAVLKAQVNLIAPVLPACPTTETPNQDTCFNPGASVRFYFFLRNETIGDTAHLRIINPDGSTFYTWTHNSTTDYIASYWYWVRTLPSFTGVYTFETIYNGITCSTNFAVNCGTLGATSVTELSQITVYPNPANNTLNLEMKNIDNGTYQVTLKNVVGQPVMTRDAAVADNALQQTFSIATLPNGIYFLTIESGNTRIVRKIVKQN